MDMYSLHDAPGDLWIPGVIFISMLGCMILMFIGSAFKETGLNLNKPWKRLVGGVLVACIALSPPGYWEPGDWYGFGIVSVAAWMALAFGVKSVRLRDDSSNSRGGESRKLG